MKLQVDKLKKMKGYEEGKGDAIDEGTLAIALSYKKNFLKEFIPIGPDQIGGKLGDGNYFVTRKYDGEFATIVYDRGVAITINRSGRVRRGIPCIREAAELLAAAGVEEAVVPAEIYVYDRDKRTRTQDLLHALSKRGDVSRLRLAVFDLLELDDEPYRPQSYLQTWEKLVEIFGNGKMVRPVEMERAFSAAEVETIYREWVEEGTAEGLVVRGELPFVFKIKPRHSLDAVVVGFTEGTGDQQGMVRTFLVALMPHAGVYQVVGRVGGGMKEALREKMFRELSELVVPSDFIDTDSNFVAFRMVQPVRVMEFSVRDVIYETPNGAVYNNQLVLDEGRYRLHATVTGLSLIAPVFERFRQDKEPNDIDARLSQIEEFSSFEPEEIVSVPQLETASSELLLRSVYRKRIGSKSMLQKYLVWKTNKQQTGEFPAYVLYYLNYSSQRQEPLQREVRVSASEGQIMELYERMLEKNIKQGWVKASESLQSVKSAP